MMFLAGLFERVRRMFARTPQPTYSTDEAEARAEAARHRIERSIVVLQTALWRGSGGES